MKPGQLFYIQRDENVAGPYDLVQMAGLLRRKIITAETMTRRDGEDAWKAFSWQPQFSIAREMSPDVVSSRVAELDEEAMAAKSGPIMLPSRETLLKLGGLVFGALLAGAGSYLIARLDTTTGYCLLIGGIASAVVAHCFILARILDEDYLTLGAMVFIPGYDFFYFITNLWQYFNLFCVKYVGIAVAIGAALALRATIPSMP